MRVTSTRWRADTPIALPGAFGLFASLERVTTDAGKEAVRVHAYGIVGQSGVGMLARLCVFDEELRARVREHLQEEAELEPNAIVAEIAHVPSPQIANGVLRPVLRAFEIDCFAGSGAPKDAVIPLRDLRVSVADGRIVLRSMSRGRVVLPRSTTAHNARTADSTAYRFLAELARQGETRGVGWSWGRLASAPFLPGVVAHGAVLASARWRIFADELRAIREGDGDEARRAAVQALRLAGGFRVTLRWARTTSRCGWTWRTRSACARCSTW